MLTAPHDTGHRPTAPPRIQGPADWIHLVAGLGLVFALFQWSATMLGSDRGQHGILVAALVVVATAVAGFPAQKRHRRHPARLFGLGRPQPAGMAAAAGVSVLLLIAGLLFCWIRGMTPSFYPGWLWLVPGLFAQAGIAEEVLFRGFLFNQVRAGRTFWRAAALSMLPFAAVHLILFFSMPWPIALASVLLATVLSFPLAHLFELGGGTIWPPAILHFVIQATVKVLVFSDGGAAFALMWMVASSLVPLLVFAVRSPGIHEDPA